MPYTTDVEAPRKVHAFASRPHGVHALPVEEAVEMVRASADGEPPLVWIDVVNPGEEEAAFLRDQVGLHPLAVEDCIRGRQRPKMERYPGYFFLVLYATRINPERGRMALNELHVFLGTHYIVTVHDQRIAECGEILARWRSAPDRYRSVGSVAHALLDAIVDDYFPVLDHFSERVEEIEGKVMHDPEGKTMQEILALRRELTLFRRIVGPERDFLSTLLRRDLPFILPELLPYFQDVHDHVIRVAEETDVLRDLLAAALEGQLSVASNQLNQTMRLMAAWSIILMAMTLVAGIYGMNFVLMPELEWRYGYAWALAVMLAVGAVLLAYFRRRRWV